MLGGSDAINTIYALRGERAGRSWSTTLPHMCVHVRGYCRHDESFRSSRSAESRDEGVKVEPFKSSGET